MEVQLRIQGRRESARSGAGVRSVGSNETQSNDTGLLDNVEVLHAFDVSMATRDVSAPPIELTTRDDDVLEIVVDDSFTLWTSVASYREQLARYRPEAISDGAVTVQTLPQPSAAERGIKEWAASGIRILRVAVDPIEQGLKDPQRWKEFLQDFALDQAMKGASWLTAKFLMYLIERRLKPGPGLFAWPDTTGAQTLDFTSARPVRTQNLPTDRPLLIFLHGTGSSTVGSFSALAHRDAETDWKALRDDFGPHVYAFEHRTLSMSPIENAIALLEMLPAGARICLASHSRGGLVGDLLTLAELPVRRIDDYRREDDAYEQVDAYDRAQLKRLSLLLDEKKLHVERFARVACPARGTLLAADDLDQFLSTITSLIGFIPGLSASPIFQVIKRITLETAKRRLDASLIPGIECMLPTSPLVALLNDSSVRANGSLGVIAGDREGGGLLERLGTFITDRFLFDQREHDLVVNTDSMFYGARRKHTEQYAFDQGSAVSHFGYFRNGATRGAMVRWLTAKGDATPKAFQPIARDRVNAPTLSSTRALGGRNGAVVFLIPDVMASTLAIGDESIWPVTQKLAASGINVLKDATAKPVGLVEEMYGDLGRALESSCEVVRVPYDWRQSHAIAADALSEAVKPYLTKAGRPLRFVAHGAGGVVVHHLMQKPIWRDIAKRDGSRVVMLGTPFAGSWDFVLLLLGLLPVARRLALLDPSSGIQGVVDTFATFPGIVELLPAGFGLDATSQWKKLRGANVGGVGPSDKILRAAASGASTSPTIVADPDAVVCVAGSAPRTPAQIVVDNQRLYLQTTDLGDGSVLHASSVSASIPTWYASVDHGDLVIDHAMLRPIQQLLESGSTRDLSTVPSASRGVSDARVVCRPQPVLYPTDLDLLPGVAPRRRRAYVRATRPRVTMRVVHGDLRDSQHIVMVGHYEGDTIVGAERILDARLGRALSKRYELGIYPGPLGSVAVVECAPGTLRTKLDVAHGAVIIGLGKMGELSAATLANAIRDGALQYILTQSDRIGSGDVPPDVGLTVLLIGTMSSASIAVRDSVGAIVRGIAQAVRESERSEARCRLTRVDLVELLADAAIDAARALPGLAKDIGDDLGVTIEAAERMHASGSGLLRTSQDSGSGRWRRWEVTAVPAPPPAPTAPMADVLREFLLADSDELAPDLKRAMLDVFLPRAAVAQERQMALRYLVITDRARAEVMVQARQPRLVDDLVQDSISDASLRIESARLLGNLLIPNELRDTLAQQGRLVLVVDEETANYPWELLLLGTEPLCVQIPFVRQLQTADYRAQLRAATVQAAYVMGEPLTSPGIPPLPNARAEAEIVQQLLQEGGYTAFECPEPKRADQVIDTLLARPYRIVHLAGHGFFEAASDGRVARGGLVLDDGKYLTAVEIGKMTQVPDLVFLNCCHLAQVGEERKGPAVAYNKLAASLARELIQIGVRAVVAAGWAVRDDAALLFAKSFYEMLLNGSTFGDALFEARRRTWRHYPDSNTWGAYQAYGDPDFRLRSLMSRRDDRVQFVAIEEALAAINLVGSKHDGRDVAAKTKALSGIEQACAAEWLARSGVLCALGDAYRSISRYDEAIKYYDRALQAASDDAGVSIKAAEQWANIEARHGEANKNKSMIEGAIGRIDALLVLGTTAERLAIRASAYKSKANLETEPDAIRAALRKSAEEYHAAARIGGAPSDAYALLNALTLDALAGTAPKDWKDQVAACIAAAKRKFALAPDFWSAVQVVDAEFVSLWLGSRMDDKTADHLAAMYVEARRLTDASAGFMSSVVRQLRTIDATLAKLGKLPGDNARSCVQRILGHLDGEASGAATNGAGATHSAKQTDRSSKPKRKAAARRSPRPRKKT